jgi:hypothetical protein
MVTPVTSGTATAQPSIYRIIRTALRRIRAIAEGETPSIDMMTDALDAANDMVKSWQAIPGGLRLWSETEGTLFLNAGQIQYQIGLGSPDPAALTGTVTYGALASPAGGGSSLVPLLSSGSIASGDAIGVQLDSGVNFWTTINGAPSSGVVRLAQALPSQASAGQFVYSYPQSGAIVRPLKVPAARRYQYLSQVDTPVIMEARLDYQNMPNKLNRGLVTQAFYDAQIRPPGAVAFAPIVGLMNVWPAPVDNQSALRFTMQRPLQDWTSLVQVPDFPQEWNRALTWNLAKELGPEFGASGTRTWDDIKENAATSLASVSAMDREQESVFFGVANMGFGRQ